MTLPARVDGNNTWVIFGAVPSDGAGKQWRDVPYELVRARMRFDSDAAPVDAEGRGLQYACVMFNWRMSMILSKLMH